MRGQTLIEYINSEEGRRDRINALLIRHKFYLALSRNLMNIAVELAAIERQLREEGVII